MISHSIKSLLSVVMHLTTHIWSGPFRHGSVVGLVSQLGQSDVIAVVVHYVFCEIDPFLAFPPFIGPIEDGAKRTWGAEGGYDLLHSNHTCYKNSDFPLWGKVLGRMINLDHSCGNCKRLKL